MNDSIEDIVLKLFEKEDVFTKLVMSSERKKVMSIGSEMIVTDESGVQYDIQKDITAIQVFLKKDFKCYKSSNKSFVYSLMQICKETWY